MRISDILYFKNLIKIEHFIIERSDHQD